VLHVLEPFVDLFEPFVDLFEPLVDLFEPLVDLFEPLVHLLESLPHEIADVLEPLFHPDNPFGELEFPGGAYGNSLLAYPFFEVVLNIASYLFQLSVSELHNRFSHTALLVRVY
jgi:hypothetical protein